ncbi:MAG: 50S ribosomal protein L11 methyltransferase [Luteibaculaceae bacterium]
MHYTKVEFDVSPRNPYTDILVAELGDLPYNVFEETDLGVIAYIESDNFLENELKTVVESEFFQDCAIKYSITTVEKQNWNAQWEESFSPIVVPGKFSIRANFHSPTNEPFDIIINPKMSFGTGHHETTRMVCEFLVDMDLQDKTVLDVGTGTGVLAILSLKKGAKFAFGNDIDEWSVENSIENATLNSVQPRNYEFLKGDLDVIPPQVYDVICANINKLTLMKHFEQYSRLIAEQGTLFISGFFVTDAQDLISAANQYGFVLDSKKYENNWCALAFLKNN